MYMSWASKNNSLYMLDMIYMPVYKKSRVKEIVNLLLTVEWGEI